jgi:hypothetical protein
MPSILIVDFTSALPRHCSALSNAVPAPNKPRQLERQAAAQLRLNVD